MEEADSLNLESLEDNEIRGPGGLTVLVSSLGRGGERREEGRGVCDGKKRIEETLESSPACD